MACLPFGVQSPLRWLSHIKSLTRFLASAVCFSSFQVPEIPDWWLEVCLLFVSIVTSFCFCFFSDFNKKNHIDFQFFLKIIALFKEI